MSGHEIVITRQVSYRPACICGWTGQEWETEHGAGLDGDFHLEHPALTTGEHPVVEEGGER